MEKSKAKKRWEGVLTAAKKEIQEYRESPAWLQNAIPFDHAYRLTNEQKEKLLAVFDALELPDRLENRMNFEILLANLRSCGMRKPLMISRNPNDYKKGMYVKAGSSTIKIIDHLHQRGFIQLKKGYKMENAARMTRIWATEKLLSYFRELPNSVIYEPVNLVELRDKKGKLKEYRDTARTLKIKSILKAANKVNGMADIRYRQDKLNASLVAIFNRKFTLYGRLHARGYRHYKHYQGFSKEDRQEITINGESTTELDFCGMHPHLLYAKEGRQFFGDPYSLVNQNPIARPFLKIILLALLNAKDETTAERAGNYWLYNHHRERERLKEIGISSAGSVIPAFRKAHKRIDHYFCTGKETGLRIMNLDAQIALDIVKHFTEQKIPILAIHDSFIVQRQHRTELMETMQRIYRKHTGFRIPVTIEF